MTKPCGVTPKDLRRLSRAAQRMAVHDDRGRTSRGPYDKYDQILNALIDRLCDHDLKVWHGRILECVKCGERKVRDD